MIGKGICEGVKIWEVENDGIGQNEQKWKKGKELDSSNNNEQENKIG